MKSKILRVVTAGTTLLSLYAPATACNQGGGGGYRQYPSNNYNSQYSQTYSRPVTQPLVKPAVAVKPAVPVAPPVVAVTPTEPTARLTVVADTPSKPTGNLQLTSPAKVDEKSATPPAPEKAVDLTAATTPVTPPTPAPVPEPSKIADAIKGLVGNWMAVSRQSNGELSTVELQLDDNGWAKLTVPGPDGKASTTTRKVEFENSELKLTGADADVMLGKLVEFNARQMVLERSGGQVTFVRP